MLINATLILTVTKTWIEWENTNQWLNWKTRKHSNHYLAMKRKKRRNHVAHYTEMFNKKIDAQQWNKQIMTIMSHHKRSGDWEYWWLSNANAHAFFNESLIDKAIKRTLRNFSGALNSTEDILMFDVSIKSPARLYWLIFFLFFHLMFPMKRFMIKLDVCWRQFVNTHNLDDMKVAFKCNLSLNSLNIITYVALKHLFFHLITNGTKKFFLSSTLVA